MTYRPCLYAKGLIEPSERLTLFARRQPRRGQDPHRRGAGGRGNPRPQAHLLHRLPAPRLGPRARCGQGPAERRLRFYAHLSLLIVDEVGYLDVDKQGADLLFQLVSRRYERRSTIVTTNVGMGSWAIVFGDPVVASAIADRLCHHCHLIRITGRSYRTKDLAPQDRASPAVVADSGAPR